jgi:cell division protein FtsZ
MTSTDGNIRLIGIGGYGSTVIEDLLLDEEWQTDCVLLAMDHQTESTSSAQQVIRVDESVIESTTEDQERDLNELKVQIRQALRGTEVSVITSGIGVPATNQLVLLVAQIAKELRSWVIVFVTTPFAFEGDRRTQKAYEAIEQLRSIAQVTVELSNRRIRGFLGPTARMTEAFNASATIIKDAFRGLKNMVDQNGVVNLDLEDLCSALDKKGLAAVGRGEARGEDKIETAVLKAISNPLLENSELKSAQTLIVMLQSGNDFRIGSLEDINVILRNLFSEKADILIGVTSDTDFYSSAVATIMALGIPCTPQPELRSEPPKLAWRKRE